MRLQTSLVFTMCLLFSTVSGFSVVEATSCASGYYFNTTLLECKACEVSNSQASADGTSCVCKPRYKATYDSTTQKLTTCTSCGTGYTFGPDRTKCYEGSSTVTAVNDVPACTVDNYIPYLTSAGTVNCRECPYGQYAIKQVTTGSCVKCPHPRQQYVSVNGQYKCTCSADTEYQDLDGTTTCILKTDTSKLTEYSPDVYINYRQVERPGTKSLSSAKVQSPFFSYYYKEAYYKCLVNLNITACQVLANMCVLNMYSQDSTMCKVIINIQSTLPTVSGQSYSEYA